MVEEVGEAEQWGRATKTLQGLVIIFIILTVVMVSWIHTYVKTYQIAHLSMFRLLYVNDTSRKLFFFLKGKKAVEGKTRKGKKSMHILMIPENPVLQGTKNPLWNEAKYKRLENIWLG